MEFAYKKKKVSYGTLENITTISEIDYYTMKQTRSEKTASSIHEEEISKKKKIRSYQMFTKFIIKLSSKRTLKKKREFSIIKIGERKGQTGTLRRFISLSLLSVT